VPMKNPPHPGRIVRQDCVDPLKLTITQAAKVLGVTRQALNNLVNGKAGISPEMAVRLSKAFGGSPEVWLRLQANYDLAHLRQDRIDVTRYRRASGECQPAPAFSKGLPAVLRIASGCPPKTDRGRSRASGIGPRMRGR
jgi:addiction module HigA family antidote